MYQPKAVYDSLFEVAWKTVDCFAKDPKDLAKAGMIAISISQIATLSGQALGPTIILASTFALHRTESRTDKKPKLEDGQKSR